MRNLYTIVNKINSNNSYEFNNHNSNDISIGVLIVFININNKISNSILSMLMKNTNRISNILLMLNVNSNHNNLIISIIPQKSSLLMGKDEEKVKTTAILNGTKL